MGRRHICVQVLLGIKSVAIAGLWIGVLTSHVSLSAQTSICFDLVGQWHGTNGTGANRVSVAGDRAFLGCGSRGLQIIDVTDPTHPTQMGGVPMGGSPYDVEVVGSYAFVAVYGKGLQVVDVSNPYRPQYVARSTSESYPYALEIVGQYGYVADFDSGLFVYDLSDPTNFSVYGSASVAGNPCGLRISGDYAYIAAYSEGLQVLDIQNPAQPVTAGSLSDEGVNWAIDVAGNYAFIANIDFGLRVIDVSTPSHPRSVATLTLKNPTGVRLVGSRAFVCLYGGGIQVVDVSDPEKPVLAGSFQMAGNSRGIDVVGSYVYVADTQNGLVILHLIEQPICFSQQPQSVQVETGQTATFTAKGISVAPFTYQWQKDENNLQDSGRVSGISTSTLTISNATAADQGCYSLIISNSYGRIASSNVSLSVVPGLREALDDPNLVWSTEGPWRADYTVTHDAVDAAQAGPLQAGFVGEQSTLTTSITGPGTLRFWWKLQNPDCFNLDLQVGAATLASYGAALKNGTMDWQQQILRMPTGNQTLKWTFSTFCGDGSPAGSGWLDEVQFIPDISTLSLVVWHDNQLTLDVRGSVGTHVQIQFSTDLFSWGIALSDVLLDGGKATVNVTPPDSRRGFFRAVATR